MSNKLGWGIIGAGRIAGVFAKGLSASRGLGERVAVGSRSRETADQFAQKFEVPKAYGSYDALLADPDVHAVYISTPHPMHAEWAIKSAEAGKHILCEKPVALNYAEAMAVVEAARANDVFLMEAFMYRCHPQTAKLVELIREKAIGDVRVIQATFSFQSEFNIEKRHLSNALGGGGILDVGCYCTSMARLIAGAAVGKPFEEPVDIRAMGHIGDQSRVDEYALAILRFPGDILAELSTGVQVQQENVVRIFGTEGSILLRSPWFASRDAGVSKIVVNRTGEETREVPVESDRNIYGIEADIVAENIAKRQAPSPAMTWDDTLGNMRTLDGWRTAVGMVYDVEQPNADFPTADHRPLRIRTDAAMQYGEVAGIDKPVSRLVFGSMLVGAHLPLPHGSILFDYYFANGGNCFDTAHIYGGGSSERTLGQWIKNRGIRDSVVILDKGAHTPNCTPEGMSRQLFESLDRLQTDYVDLYMLHRDNPEIPVGEFVDVLNEHKTAGRIRAFGGSNWTIARIEEANAYAASKGLTGFSAVSNNFSLAQVVEPMWAGSISSSDPESVTWFERTRFPLFAWSSLARGFFAEGPVTAAGEAGLIRCWHSEENFERRERAKQLAEKRGVSVAEVVLAYVLCQPFPLFALIGARTIDELRVSLKALELKLTSEEMKWLNLEV